MTRRLVVGAGTIVPGERSLDAELAHYLRDVLRLPVGSPLELTDGEGVRARATIRAIERRAVRIDIEAIEREPRPRGPAVTLLQAVGKGDKVDAVVRQAAELGVARIVPVVTRRAVAEREKRVLRWQGIADDALRVSGRCHRTRIEPVTPLAAALGGSRASLSLCPDLGASRALRDILSQAGNPGTVEVLIGPEGGFEPEERAAVEGAGFLRVSLGPFTLRTETAGPALIAILQYVLGALDPS
ncbi:MAG: 16S rRNA (uracil(1498)-N(3))-methyltransferase [Deltaproteobacteria bacterium]|nr:16S rRNA (uracil(1498)-N(3))-methyltransferase [Deltaproteobacteria bacterium]